MQTLCECHERVCGVATDLDPGEDCSLGKTLACMGNDEPILVGKGVLEKELERHQKKLNGPKNTAKQIEAKQNWINRESKRIETESVKVAEMQESIRVRKGTPRAAYEEIKKLRADLLREGESMDKNRSHFIFPESLEEVRKLEQDELNLRRGTTSTRLARWTRDGSTERQK